jgi:hypothetical protein
MFMSNVHVYKDLDDGNTVWTFKTWSIKYTKWECISSIHINQNYLIDFIFLLYRKISKKHVGWMYFY